ncbi:hypothetical protein GCM10009819_00470 [Agromyces tropicus]|uniref:ATP-binding protein n=1 Tax=Agromyces tropicus TaxID=555371 RepID=A0ABN2TVA0_9MICO
MRVRRLEIKNFRGIKSLDWALPSDQRLIVLVGPGDSGKSTILEAIHYLLGDRWNIPVSDTDFYGVDVSSPIVVKAVLVDIPDALRKENAFGLWLSGLDAEGVLHQDPEDDHTPAMIACLTVDETLEPKWTVERVDGQSQVLTSSQRHHFSTFKVDDRNDTQLRWTRTSALGRMSVRDGGDRQALSAASRAAQQALASHESASLTELAAQVQARANSIGGGQFTDIKPGLDTSRSSMGAGLALYEDVVPLTSFGLGSRRLASLAIQQLAAGSRAVAVVDEIEDGLEPHRAVRLLNYLLADDDYSQVVVTTHSPVVVEQAQIANLATVQSHDGVVTITSLAGASEELQRVRRSRPSSLLARRVIVAEGKTEHGLLMACLDAWDTERIADGRSTSAGEGVAVQDGQGGSEVPRRAAALSALGYAVAGFMDNEDRSVDAAVEAAESTGVTIVRWDTGHNIESQICANLNANGLTKFVELGVERRAAESTVLDDLTSIDSANPITSLDVQTWISAGTTLDEARDRIAVAANKRKWFKEVDDGRALGEWIMQYRTRTALREVVRRLDDIYAFVYPQPLPIETEDTEVGSDPSAHG